MKESDSGAGPGSVVARSWQRVRAIFGGGEGQVVELDPEASGLVVVAVSTDEAAAASGVLDSSQWRPEEPAVLRHILSIPSGSVAAVCDIAAIDGYRQVPVPQFGPTAVEGATSQETSSLGVAGAARGSAGATVVGLARAQQISAVTVSQERSRMASLGSRHGGRVLGWQVLQAPDGQPPEAESQ